MTKKQKKKRLKNLAKIMCDDSVLYCRLRKDGSFYRPRSRGYTQSKSKAGIYEKRDAFRHAKSCNELQMMPINKVEHNEMIREEIKFLQGQILHILPSL